MGAAARSPAPEAGPGAFLENSGEVSPAVRLCQHCYPGLPRCPCVTPICGDTHLPDARRLRGREGVGAERRTDG